MRRIEKIFSLFLIWFSFLDFSLSVNSLGVGLRLFFSSFLNFPFFENFVRCSTPRGFFLNVDFRFDIIKFNFTFLYRSV